MIRQIRDLRPTLLVLVALAPALPATAQQQLTLAEATAAALGAHPTVAGAAARTDMADRRQDAARAARLPGVALTAGLTQFEEPMVVAPLHNLDFSTPPQFDRTLVQGRLAVAYTVFDGGARGARIRAAGAVSSAARSAESEAHMAVLEETATAYLGLQSARALSEAAERHVAALEGERRRAIQHVEAGTAAELERLRAEAALQDARARLTTASSRVGLGERMLSRITGMDAEAIGRSTLRPVTPRTAAPPAGARSPLLDRAGLMVDAAEHRLSGERALRLPKIEAGAGLLEFGSVGGDNVTEWQAGFQVSVPIFTGGARSSAVRMAEADLLAARSDLATTELRVEAAADVARTSLLEAEARVEALAVSVTQWEEVARIEALAIAAGSGVQSDLLRAEAGLFQARAGHAQARHDAALAFVKLARAQGILDQAWISAVLGN